MSFYEEMTAALDERTLEILKRRRKTAIVKRRGWLVRRALVLADVVGLVLAFVAAQLLSGPGGGPLDDVSFKSEFVIFFLTLPGWILLAKLHGLYDHDEERTDHATPDDLIGVFHLVTIGAWLFFAGAWFTGLADPNLPKVLTFWALAIVLITVARASARAFCRRRLTYLQNTVIVGAGDVGQLVARKLLQHSEYGINLVGFVDATPKERRRDLEHLALLGRPDDLPTLVRLLDIERVVIAFSNEPDELTVSLMRSLKDLDLQVDIVPRLFELIGSNVGVHTVEGLPLVGLPPFRLSRSAIVMKRAMDVSFSIVGLILLSPLLAFIAAMVKLSSPGPVFFRQVRMGAREKVFRIYKFRTMTSDAEAQKSNLTHLNQYAENGGDTRMFKISDDPRTTRFGCLLRRYSLDEIPQLINVLKGEMSLVGPRPLILAEDQYVREWARQRLNLKPGITGPWQVFGRNDIPFEEMVKLDYQYVTGWSPFNDFKLILRTVPAVLRVRSAY
jgi:exopolysaccharide biosynthesis polyprenyl glycosylphosphotransferase